MVTLVCVAVKFVVFTHFEKNPAIFNSSLAARQSRKSLHAPDYRSACLISTAKPPFNWRTALYFWLVLVYTKVSRRKPSQFFKMATVHIEMEIRKEAEHPHTLNLNGNVSHISIVEVMREFGEETRIHSQAQIHHSSVAVAAVSHVQACIEKCVCVCVLLASITAAPFLSLTPSSLSYRYFMTEVPLPASPSSSSCFSSSLTQ